MYILTINVVKNYMHTYTCVISIVFFQYTYIYEPSMWSNLIV